jgi:predicted nucleic acid binding AN1-type Zn finger protein
LHQNGRVAIVIVSDTEDCSLASPGSLLFSADASLGPESDLRCFMNGNMCNKTIAKDKPGTYTNCSPLTSSDVLLPPGDAIASFTKQVALFTSSLVGVYPITAQSSSETIVSSPGGLAGQPACQLNQGEFALPSPRLDQSGAMQFHTVDSVCAKSWTNTFAQIGNDLLQ